MSLIRFPMIITCIIKNPLKLEEIFDRLLREAGYVKISEKAYVHQGGEQLTATISFGRTYLPEIDAIKDCLTLYLSDAESIINLDLCEDLNRVLTQQAEVYSMS